MPYGIMWYINNNRNRQTFGKANAQQLLRIYSGSEPSQFALYSKGLKAQQINQRFAMYIKICNLLWPFNP